jgi:subtilisin family serine protease
MLALATLLLISAGVALSAPIDPRDQIDIKGRKFVQDGGRWYQQESPARRFEVVPEVVTVKFKPGTASAAKGAFLSGQKVRKLRENRLGAVDITVPVGMSAVEFVARLQGEGVLEFAEVNTYGTYHQTIPNDTRFDELWGLDNTGQTGGTSDADIDAPEAWDLSTGSPDVVVAVVDSGTEYDHEDLECNIWVNPGEDRDGDRVVWDTDDLNGVDDDANGHVDDLVGWDYDDGDNDPRGSYFHGTHVAGIVAACGDNSLGVIGVAGGTGTGAGVRLMVLNAGDAKPNGAVLDDAIDYAVANGARVITMSLSVAASTAITDALSAAFDAGVFISNASGNEDHEVGFPATDEHVMAVGSTDHNDERASSSNFGPELDIAAPGVSILSTQLGDTYDHSSGTSFASPHVAGTAALMFSLNPAATNTQVRDCITSTADDLGAAGRDDYYGFGRLNAAAALGCISPNKAPICDANGPYVAECGVDTVLDGTGSSDPDGDALTYSWTGPFLESPATGPTPTVIFPSPTGTTSVTLTVDDTEFDASCPASVQVSDTLPPYLVAPPDVTAECTSSSGTLVDIGDATVYDECDQSLALGNNAPARFPLGSTKVTYTVTDDDLNQSTAQQRVTVVDSTPPAALCNAPTSITPTQAPVSFTATASDSCGAASAVVMGYKCYFGNKAGKRVNRTPSCEVAVAGDTITVLDSGGVADNIVWTIVATDASGNTATRECKVVVTLPTP